MRWSSGVVILLWFVLVGGYIFIRYMPQPKAVYYSIPQEGVELSENGKIEVVELTDPNPYGRIIGRIIDSLIVGIISLITYGVKKWIDYIFIKRVPNE